MSKNTLAMYARNKIQVSRGLDEFFVGKAEGEEEEERQAAPPTNKDALYTVNALLKIPGFF